MQLQPHELIKLLAETEKRTAEAIIAKMKQEEKPKQQLIKIEVTYELHDMENDSISYSYNIVMTDCATNAIKTVITGLQAKFLSSEIVLEYNPVCMIYQGYKHTKAEGKICVLEIRNIRDCIIDRIEI